MELFIKDVREAKKIIFPMKVQCFFFFARATKDFSQVFIASSAENSQDTRKNSFKMQFKTQSPVKRDPSTETANKS